MSIVYFAHSYRERDASVVDFFARLIRSEGLTVSLDPPSQSVNSAKLQRHLNASDGMEYAVLSSERRNLAAHPVQDRYLRSRTVSHSSSSSRTRSPVGSSRRGSRTAILAQMVSAGGSGAPAHAQGVRSYLHEYSPPRFRPAAGRRRCGRWSESINSSVAAQIQEWVDAGADYEMIALEAVTEPYETYEVVRHANLALVLLGDRRPGYLEGLLAGIGIPTIDLAWGDDEVARPEWPPSEYLERWVTQRIRSRHSTPSSAGTRRTFSICLIRRLSIGTRRFWSTCKLRCVGLVTTSKR